MEEGKGKIIFEIEDGKLPQVFFDFNHLSAASIAFSPSSPLSYSWEK